MRRLYLYKSVLSLPHFSAFASPSTLDTLFFEGVTLHCASEFSLNISHIHEQKQRFSMASVSPEVHRASSSLVPSLPTMLMPKGEIFAKSQTMNHAGPNQIASLAQNTTRNMQTSGRYSIAPGELARYLSHSPSSTPLKAFLADESLCFCKGCEKAHSSPFASLPPPQ